jgi:hypothetical protein
MKRDEITSEKTESIHTIILAKKGAYDRSRQKYAMHYYNLAHISKDYALLRGNGKFFGYDYNTRNPKVFDFKEMKAEKIKVLLTGLGALCDRHGVEKYLNGLGIGESEVNIEI